LLTQLGDADLPIHIHVAEQTAEVDDCVRQLGQRPVRWLARRLDPRWQLVHATHLAPDEVEAIAASGAGVVLCPGTEANLGDGLPPLREGLQASIPLSLGSDSQVTREWREELRWLEYTQRLLARQRNVCADPAYEPSTAARLFNAMVRGSARPAGFAHWGLQRGARADWLVLDPAAEGLERAPLARQLDALVFASRGPVFAEVGVGGQVRTPRVCSPSDKP
jgi:formimidoylglutamate deiminase